MGLVQQYFAGEPSCADPSGRWAQLSREFAINSLARRRLLFSGNSARFRGGGYHLANAERCLCDIGNIGGLFREENTLIETVAAAEALDTYIC